MFPNRYWGRYWADRYWPPIGFTVVPGTDLVIFGPDTGAGDGYSQSAAGDGFGQLGGGDSYSQAGSVDYTQTSLADSYTTRGGRA